MGAMWLRPHKFREECRAINQECYYCGRLGHFSKVCRQSPDNQSSKVVFNHIDTEEQSPDYTLSEYTTPYFLTNNQAKASIKCLKTTAKVHHMHNRDTEHIRPLWVAQSQGSQVSQTVKLTQEQAATSYQPTELSNYLIRND